MKELGPRTAKVALSIGLKMKMVGGYDVIF